MQFVAFGFMDVICPTLGLPYGIISPAQLVSLVQAISLPGGAWAQHGDVLELADRHDLGSCAERRE